MDDRPARRWLTPSEALNRFKPPPGAMIGTPASQRQQPRYGFCLGDLGLLIERNTTSELLESTPVYPLPGAPNGLLGLVNLRGNLASVFDLKHILHLNSDADLASAAEAMQNIAQLAQTCNVAAEAAIQTTQAALHTVTNTVDGINGTRDTIRETEKRIKRLGERSQEITGVVNLINTIAERMHILALNASMHAASGVIQSDAGPIIQHDLLITLKETFHAHP